MTYKPRNGTELVSGFWETRARALHHLAENALRRGLPLIAADLQDRGLQIQIAVQAERRT
jgi:hypothetical protein